MVIFNRLGKQQKNFYDKPKGIATVDPESTEKLWSETAEFDDAWKQRISLMADYITLPGAVADFGCGMMWLEEYLKPENTYIPIDYMARDARTIVVDLNQDSLPNLTARVAFMSGVLEYVSHPEKIIRYLAKQNVEQLIIAYCTLEKFSSIDRRKSLNWKSHLSIFELLEHFTEDYSLQRLDEISKNSVFVLLKK
jgi:hypothetical protein